jgi:hypothetical protein
MALTEHVEPLLRKRVIAGLIADALLPSLETVAAHYPFLAWGPDGWIKVCFDVDDISRGIVFKRGLLSIRDKVNGRPDTVIRISAAGALDALAAGRPPFSSLSITRGAWRADLLSRAAGLLGAFALVANPRLKPPLPFSPLLRARLLAGTALRAAAVVGSLDPRAAEVISGFNGEALAVGAGEDSYSLSFFTGRVVFSERSQGNSAAWLSFPSVELFSRAPAAFVDAWHRGSISFGGESELIVCVGYLLLRCMDYLGFSLPSG